MKVRRKKPPVPPSSDGVVLLHGIFRTRRSMQHFARYLEKNGLRTLNLTYPSTKRGLEEIVHHLHPAIEAFAKEIPGKLHFVGHSMGGLVIRAYLNRFQPSRLGRVVMLGVPNQGSELADIFRNWWLYKKLYGPAGQQLVTAHGDTEALFGPVHYELGIIAGRWPLRPISSLLIREPNDGTVSIASTKLEGMKEHIVVIVSHTFFPLSRRVWRLTLHFLRKGVFTSAEGKK